jgi:hypothetical protein
MTGIGIVVCLIITCYIGSTYFKQRKINIGESKATLIVDASIALVVGFLVSLAFYASHSGDSLYALYFFQYFLLIFPFLAFSWFATIWLVGDDYPELGKRAFGILKLSLVFYVLIFFCAKNFLEEYFEIHIYY